MGRGVLAVVAWLGLSLAARCAEAQTVTLKVASLAPKGSVWAKSMENGARRIRDATAGRVTVQHFFGAQMGDERAMIRQMIDKKLDGAALTAVGLGLIHGDVRVLELPFLFDNDKQVAYVRDKVEGTLSQELERAGYVVIAWTGLGWVHLYTNQKIQSRQALGKTKMWAWSDDRIVQTMFKRLGVETVKLGVPEVLPSLRAGRIDACYTVPTAAVALQWFTKVKYATQVPISYSLGAYVIRKDVLDRLTPADQAAIRQAGAAIGAELSKGANVENARAKKAMTEAGIRFVPSPAQMVAAFKMQGQAVWPVLAGDVYSKAILDETLKHRAAAIRLYPGP